MLRAAARLDLTDVGLSKKSTTPNNPLGTRRWSDSYGRVSITKFYKKTKHTGPLHQNFLHFRGDFFNFNAFCLINPADQNQQLIWAPIDCRHRLRKTMLLQSSFFPIISEPNRVIQPTVATSTFHFLWTALQRAKFRECNVITNLREPGLIKGGAGLNEMSRNRKIQDWSRLL